MRCVRHDPGERRCITLQNDAAGLGQDGITRRFTLEFSQPYQTLTLFCKTDTLSAIRLQVRQQAQSRPDRLAVRPGPYLSGLFIRLCPIFERATDPAVVSWDNPQD